MYVTMLDVAITLPNTPAGRREEQDSDRRPSSFHSCLIEVFHLAGHSKADDSENDADRQCDDRRAEELDDADDSPPMENAEEIAMSSDGDDNGREREPTVREFAIRGDELFIGLDGLVVFDVFRRLLLSSDRFSRRSMPQAAPEWISVHRGHGRSADCRRHRWSLPRRSGPGVGGMKQCEI
jgi:hypothetical protein